MCPPKFHELLYKLLTTLCVVSDCAPPPNQKVFPTPLTKGGREQFPGIRATIFLQSDDAATCCMFLSGYHSRAAFISLESLQTSMTAG